MKSYIGLYLFCQTRSIQSNEKEHVRQIYHCDAHCYVINPIIPQSVPMIGRLELAFGTLTLYTSWVWLV